MLAASLFVYAFGAMLLWGIGDFLIQRTIRKIGTLETLGLIGLIGSIVLAPFAMQSFSLAAGILLLLLGTLVFTSGVMNFEALKVGKLAIVDIVMTLELPITILLALLILKESLTIVQVLIISMAFIGIVLMVLDDPRSLRWEHGAFLALLTALAYGSVNFFTAIASRVSTPLLAIWVPWIILALFCFLSLAGTKRLPALPLKVKGAWKLVLAVGIVDTLAWLSYAFAVRGGEVSIITAITESYPAIAMVLGVMLNRERMRGHQWVGAGIALFASSLLTLL